ncbi:MAG: sugar ABC transporter ATP-binding protein [Eubacteriales bacterium]|nr:sugar ABC transporter ATP-binding protein [Eubacteriales bacterium]
MSDYQYVLELKDIVKLFPGVRALDGMAMKIRPASVHVICGENGAGKSTLMKVISGEYIAEEGEVIYQGKKLGKRSILETMNMGISMIHQEMNPIKGMTVAQNIFLGREPQNLKGFVDFKTMNKETQALMDQLHIPYKATQLMGELNLAGQQQVEIAKAISMNAKVLIMDEPTSSLADREVENLFKQVRDLKEQGVAIIYITHKMDEIFRIADDVTVIRDGSWILTKPASELTVEEIITNMVGREVKNLYPENKAKKGETILEVKDLNSAKFKDVSFYVRSGEILGFSGLVGAGRSELMRAIFGLDPHTSGQILVNGKEVKISKSGDGIKNGIAMLSEDRRMEGIIPIRSIRENISVAFIDHFTKFKIINQKRERETADAKMKELKVRAASPTQEIRTLSGGNQQKALLARWLIGDTKVLILDEPTRGIDVGSKEEIHQLMCECAESGMAVIMISSELPEVLGMSDRIYVMAEGRITGELSKEEKSEAAIMKFATC